MKNEYNVFIVGQLFSKLSNLNNIIFGHIGDRYFLKFSPLPWTLDILFRYMQTKSGFFHLCLFKHLLH